MIWQMFRAAVASLKHDTHHEGFFFVYIWQTWNFLICAVSHLHLPLTSNTHTDIHASYQVLQVFPLLWHKIFTNRPCGCRDILIPSWVYNLWGEACIWVTSDTTTSLSRGESNFLRRFLVREVTSDQIIKQRLRSALKRSENLPNNSCTTLIRPWC